MIGAKILLIIVGLIILYCIANIIREVYLVSKGKMDPEPTGLGINIHSMGQHEKRREKKRRI